MSIRLDKCLADSGYGTRSEVRSLVRSGAVYINGIEAKDAGARVDTANDNIVVNGESVSYSEYEYYMLYKPAGIISASSDKKEKTVVDLIDSKKRRDLFPVGRLDRDTEGLLLITNDGEFAHRLLAPGKHVEKKYMAIVSGKLPADIEGIFSSGIDIGDDKPTKPARLKIYNNRDDYLRVTSDDLVDYYMLDKYQDTCSIAEIIITEGRYHEIKRMFAACGCQIEYLKRISMGSYQLDAALKPGGYKKIRKV